MKCTIPLEKWEFLVVWIKDVDLTVTIMLRVKLMILLDLVYVRYNFMIMCDMCMYM